MSDQPKETVIIPYDEALRRTGCVVGCACILLGCICGAVTTLVGITLSQMAGR